MKQTWQTLDILAGVAFIIGARLTVKCFRAAAAVWRDENVR